MTGFRCSSFRHKCPERGCYIEQLPNWDDYGITSGMVFPRGIRPTDVDGMVEIGGNVLFLEEKGEGVPITTGQLRAFRTLAALPSVTVVAFRPKGDRLEVLVPGTNQGWQLHSLDRFQSRLRGWANLAERRAA